MKGGRHAALPSDFILQPSSFILTCAARGAGLEPADSAFKARRLFRHKLPAITLATSPARRGRAVRADLPRGGHVAPRLSISLAHCPMQESNLRPNVGMVA